MRRLAATDRIIDVVADQTGSPTYARIWSTRCFEVATGGIRGADPACRQRGAASRFEQARAVFGELGADPERGRLSAPTSFQAGAPPGVLGAVDGRSARRADTAATVAEKHLPRLLRCRSATDRYAQRRERRGREGRVGPDRGHGDLFAGFAPRPVPVVPDGGHRPQVRVIIADNGFHRRCAGEAVQRYPGTELLRTGGNLGYGTAVNRAVATLPAEEVRRGVYPDVVWGRTVSTFCSTRPPAGRRPVRWAADPRSRRLGVSLGPPSAEPGRGGMHAVVGFAWKANRGPSPTAGRLEPSERPVGWLSNPLPAGAPVGLRRDQDSTSATSYAWRTSTSGDRLEPGGLAQRLRSRFGDPATRGTPPAATRPGT